MRSLNNDDDDGESPSLPFLDVKQPHASGYDFLQLGNKIADGMILAAENHLKQAQSMVEQTQIFADGLRAQISAKNDELSTMNQRLKVFAEALLKANRVFMNGDPK